MFSVFGELNKVPDVLCRSGWWSSDAYLHEQQSMAGDHGVHSNDIMVGKRHLLGKTIECFSSSHERSRLLCAFGTSNLPKSTPCYALVWEGAIGSFYEFDTELNMTKLASVMPEPGH